MESAQVSKFNFNPLLRKLKNNLELCCPIYYYMIISFSYCMVEFYIIFGITYFV